MGFLSDLIMGGDKDLSAIRGLMKLISDYEKGQSAISEASYEEAKKDLAFLNQNNSKG